MTTSAGLLSRDRLAMKANDPSSEHIGVFRMTGKATYAIDPSSEHIEVFRMTKTATYTSDPSASLRMTGSQIKKGRSRLRST